MLLKSRQHTSFFFFLSALPGTSRLSRHYSRTKALALLTNKRVLVILFVPRRSHVKHATAATAVVLHELFNGVRRRCKVHLHVGRGLTERGLRRPATAVVFAAGRRTGPRAGAAGARVGRPEANAQQPSLARADGYDARVR